MNVFFRSDVSMVAINKAPLEMDICNSLNEYDITKTHAQLMYKVYI
jgi:hypothetical protein